MNVKDLLLACDVTEDHFAAISEAIPEAYIGLSKLVKDTPMLSQFAPGYRVALPHLRNLAVQFALEAKAASTQLFYTKMASNSIGNFNFLELQCGQVIFTAHYRGKRGIRAIPKAIYRAELAQRTPDLFQIEAAAPDFNLGSKAAYAQISHGGAEKPQYAAIRIPNRDQLTYSLQPYVLELKTPNPVVAEQVRDQLDHNFKQKIREFKEKYAG
jgi:hypothetical protein